MICEGKGTNAFWSSLEGGAIVVVLDVVCFLDVVGVLDGFVLIIADIVKRGVN